MECLGFGVCRWLMQNRGDCPSSVYYYEHAAKLLHNCVLILFLQVLDLVNIIIMIILIIYVSLLMLFLCHSDCIKRCIAI